MKEEKDNDVIFGAHSIIEALKAGKEFNKILFDKSVRNEFSQEIKELANEIDVHIQYVPLQKLNQITRKNHQGFVAFISPITYHKIDGIIPQIYEKGETPLLVILDRVTDVRNFGAIARSCECMGAHAIIIPSRGGALITSDAIKTSAGALNKIPVCKEDNLKNTFQLLADSGIQIVACTEKTEQAVSKVDFTVPTAIVMGSEENGISNEYFKYCNEKVLIPMQGEIESLNVSVSAGILLYEASRQRN